MIDILLVEDNQDDVELTKRAFSESGFAVRLNFATDGIEALKFLEDSEKDYPDLILLDINMPKMNGIEFLSSLRKHDEYNYIPVIFLTTSESELDIYNVYKNHGNCYVVKPIGFKEFLEVVENIKNYWLFISKLPKKQRKQVLNNQKLDNIKNII